MAPEVPFNRLQLLRLADLLDTIASALCGSEPFRWGESERIRNTRLLSRAGVCLLTKTALVKRGFVPKRGARAIGTGYFGAPLQVHAELFLVGVQTRERPKVIGPNEKRDGEASANQPQRRRRPHGA